MKHHFRTLLALIVLFSVALSTHSAWAEALQTGSATGLNDLSVTVYEDWRYLDSNVTVGGSDNWTDGYIDIQITSGGDTGDQLRLVSNGLLSVAGDAVSWNGNRIGTIDSTYNGVNGQRLRINFSASLLNSGFESGSFSGWTANESFPGLPGDTHNGITQTASVSTEQVYAGTYAAKLYLTGNVSVAYGTAHGPEITSSAFYAKAGDTLSLRWNALDSGDDYDVYGYLRNTSTGVEQQLFYGRGDNTAGWVTQNSTINSTVCPSGTCSLQFRFLAGSYDATGGMAVGSTMYIDGINVVTDVVTNAIADTIVESLQYRSTSNSPAHTKPYTITLRDNAGSGTASATINLSNANTTTTITSDTPDPSVYGSTFTVNVSVTANAPSIGTPNGSVSVSDGLGGSCNITLSGGTGSCSFPSGGLGNKTLTASYAGTALGYNSSNDTESHTVDKASTTTTITSDSPDSSVYGQNYTVNFSVAAVAPGSGTPSGTVTVSDGTNSCGPVALSGGSGSCSMPSTSPGSKTLTASYSGDANFLSSNDTESHTVIKSNSTTTITSDSADPSVFGQNYAVNFSVAATAPGSGTPTGTVTVSDGTNSCGPVALSGGSGSCELPSTSPGGKTLTANYSGDTNFNSSNDTEAHTVSKANTVTSIDSDMPDPSVYYGAQYSVSFSVAAAAPGAGSPTGTVTVSDGTNSCGPVTLVASAGSCNLPSTQIGPITLTATYSGDTNFNTSNDTEAHTVDKATTSTLTELSASFPVYGQPIYFSATVSTVNGTLMPTGEVQFYIDGDPFGSPMTLNGSGIAISSTIASLDAGDHTFAAAYLGDAYNHTSDSLPATSFTVSPADTTIAVVSSDDDSIFGQALTLTATVTETLPSTLTPVGEVQFSFDGTPLGDPVALSGGVATLPDLHSLLGSHPLVGAHTFSAEYLGTSNFNGSTSTTNPQAVSTAPTQVTISSSENPTVYGTTLDMTITVTAPLPSLATPAGTVQLRIDGVNFGTPLTLNGAGQAVRSVPYLNMWPGLHDVTATYTPAVPAQFITSNNNSSPFEQTVNKATPLVTITPDVASPVASQPVTYTVTLEGSMPTQGIPTGTVQFYVEGSPVGAPQTLNTSGEASLSISLDAGTQSITIGYSGDDYFYDIAASDPLDQFIGKADATVSLTGIDPSASVVGQPVTVSVLAVPNAPATQIPDGTITVSNGTDSCIATLDAAGIGSCDLEPTAPGNPELGGAYSGSGNFNTASSASFPGPVVAKANVIIAITGFAPSSPLAGQATTVSFQVSPEAPGNGIPTGDITITSGTGHTCTGTISGADSTGTCELTIPVAGTTPLQAEYTGDSNFNAKTTPNAADLVVSKAATSLATASSNAISVYGEVVDFTATVSVNAPGAGSPTGEVQFSIGGIDFGAPVALSGAVATSPSTSTLGIGDHSIGADYLGDADFLSSTADLITQTVIKADTSLVLVSSFNPSTYGVPVLVTATVTADAPSTATPNAGSVQFYVDTVAYGAPVLLNAQGQASKELPYTALWVGTHSVTAVYSGSTNFNGSDNLADPLYQVVDKGTVSFGLVTTPAAPVFGEAFTFQATVTGAGANIPKPSGTVQFNVDGVDLGTPVTLDGNGRATSIAIASLAVGTHTVELTFSGDDYYAPASGSFDPGATVIKANANAQITNASFADVVLGETFSVTFSVTAVAPGNGTPTGLVTISNGVDECSADATVGSCQITPTDVGNPNLTISYAGDDSFNPHTGTPVSGPIVNPAPTTLTITSDGNPVVYGTSVLLTVTVSANAPSSSTPEGTVQLSINGVDFGTPLTLNASGQATRLVPSSNLWPATHAMRGVYTPATPVQFESSNNNAAPYNQVVNKANPVIGITASVADPVASQPVSYTVTVSRSLPTQGTPTGTVQFYADSSPVGSPVTLNASGQASRSISLDAGAHAITVSYSGDNYFLSVGASDPFAQSIDPADTSTAITSVDPATTLVGQPVAVFVAVTPLAPATGIPGGTVTVSNGTDSCVVTLDSAGEGSCNLTPSLPGSRVLTANYGGSSDFNPSTSPEFNGLIVEKFDVSMLLTLVGPASPVVGEAVEFEVTLSPVAPGFGNPTGTVTISDGNGHQCQASIVVSGGSTATCQITFLQSGRPLLDVSYAGDESFNPGWLADVSGPMINLAATSLGIASSNPSSVYGETIQFTATLTVTAPGSGMPGGSVQFKIDGVDFGTPVPVSGGTAASQTIRTLSGGNHTITASYSGDTNYLASVAVPFDQEVLKADALIDLTSNFNPSTYGVPVLITATLQAQPPSTAQPASGSVQFYVDGVLFGAPVALNPDGTAQNLLPYTALFVGTHTITAAYSGDTNFNAVDVADSPVLNQVVDKGTLHFTLDTSVSSPVFGQDFTFLTTLAGVGSNNPSPTGTVQFYVDGTPLGSPVALDGSSSASSITVSGLSTGTHAVQVVYSGDDYYAADVLDAPTGVIIGKADVLTSITNASFPSVVYGEDVSVTFSVQAVAPGAGTPTGTVTIGNGSQTCQASVAAGNCTLSFTNIGESQLSISYAGDGNFNPAHADAIPGPDVEPADVTLSISGFDPAAVVTGQSYTVTIQTAPVAPGIYLPVGKQVTITNGVDQCTATVQADGSASCTLTPTSAGSPALTASLDGAPNFNNAVSPATTGPTVSAAQTTTTVNVSASPANEGDAVYFTAVVQVAAPGSGTPGGQIQFLVDGVNFGSPVALVNGQATSISTTTLTPGNHTISASYLGNASYQASSASPVTATIISDSVTQVITPAGGVLVYTGSIDGHTVTTTITIPASAVPSNVTIVYRQFTNSALTPPAGTHFLINFTLRVYVNGVLLPTYTFSQPVSISMQYVPDGGNENNYTVQRWSGTGWSTSGLTIVNRDLVNNNIGFRLVSTTTNEFALVAPTQYEVFLPFLRKP